MKVSPLKCWVRVCGRRAVIETAITTTSPRIDTTQERAGGGRERASVRGSVERSNKFSS